MPSPSPWEGTHAYVANWGDGSISVIRTAKQKVVATVAVGTNPFGVAASRNLTRRRLVNR
jgi:YVTN family beta-propeller protein